MAANAQRFGQAFMNWDKGEEILYREYSALLPAALAGPSSVGEMPYRAHRRGVGKYGHADPHPACGGYLGRGGLENGLVNLIERLDPARFEHVVCAIRPVVGRTRNGFRPSRCE